MRDLIAIAVAHTRASALGVLSRHRSSVHHRPITRFHARIVSLRKPILGGLHHEFRLRLWQRDFLRITGCIGEELPFRRVRQRQSPAATKAAQ